MTSITEIMQLCRLCLVKEQVNIPIFEEQGDLQQIIEKISACLPVKVSKEDKLPKKICDGCSYKLELLYQFRNTTVTAEKQLLSWINQLGGNKVENEVKSQPATQHIVKEEVDIVDTADHTDTEYLLGQQITFEGGDTPFLESQDDNGAGDDDITNSSDDEPLAKRRKRLLEDKGQNSAGESKEEVVQHMAVTKTEDASESEGEENVDDPEPNFVSVGTDDIQQPGPSGVGKAATTDIPNYCSGTPECDEVKSETGIYIKDEPFFETETEIFGDYDRPSSNSAADVQLHRDIVLPESTGLSAPTVLPSSSVVLPSPLVLPPHVVMSQPMSLPVTLPSTFNNLNYHILSDNSLIGNIIQVGQTPPLQNQAYVSCNHAQLQITLNNGMVDVPPLSNNCNNMLHTKEVKKTNPLSNKDCNYDVGVSSSSKRGLIGTDGQEVKRSNGNNETTDVTLIHSNISNDPLELKSFDSVPKSRRDNEILTHTATQRDNYTCRRCNQKFSDNMALKQHKLVHTTPERVNTYKNNKNLYILPCRHCNQKFSTKSGLRNHEKGHSKEKPFQCKQCPKSFKSLGNLCNHLLICNKERLKYVNKSKNCPLCNSPFSRQLSLTRHYKKCQQLQVYQCLFCEQKSTDPFRYSVHKQTHSNDLFECPKCEHRDGDKRNMLHHIIEAHSGTQASWNCWTCGQFFIDSNVYACHKKSNCSMLSNKS